MTTKAKRRAPEHLRGFKFERGQAVLILQRPTSMTKAHLTTVPAVVINAGDHFITAQTDQGSKRVVPTSLYHRGYCPRCEVAAHLEAGQLVCPRCEGDASMPVPDALLPEWSAHDQFTVCLYRTMLRNGCTQREAYPILERERRARWDVMLERAGLTASYERFDRFWHAQGSFDIEQQMHSAAARGDVEAFLEGVAWLKGAALYDAARRFFRAFDEQAVIGDTLLGQPARPVADSEPDGADEVTRWLDQQFRKAA